MSDLQPSGTQPEGAAEERRAVRRFKVALDLSYSVCGEHGLAAGHGRTVDVSSGGVLFETQAPVRDSAEVQLSIAWPMPLDNGVPIRLFVVGRVVRSDGRNAAVRIIRYEFRTAMREAGPGSAARWYVNRAGAASEPSAR